jgi:hypothetical protein
MENQNLDMAESFFFLNHTLHTAYRIPFFALRPDKNLMNPVLSAMC